MASRAAAATERRELEVIREEIREVLERIEANNLRARGIALRCLPKVRAFVRATVAAQDGAVAQWKSALDGAAPKRRRVEAAAAEAAAAFAEEEEEEEEEKEEEDTLANGTLNSTASVRATPTMGGDVSIASSVGGTPKTPAFRTQLAKTPALYKFQGGVVVDSFASMDETTETVGGAAARSALADRRFSWQSDDGSLLGSSIINASTSSVALDASSVSEASFGVPSSTMIRRGRSDPPSALDLSGASEIPFEASPPLSTAVAVEAAATRSATIAQRAVSEVLRSVAPPASGAAAARGGGGHKRGRGRGVTMLPRGASPVAGRDLGREDAENERRATVVPLDLTTFPSAYRTAKSAAQLQAIFAALVRLDDAQEGPITVAALQSDLASAEAEAANADATTTLWTTKRVQFLLDALRQRGRIVATATSGHSGAMSCKLVR